MISDIFSIRDDLTGYLNITLDRNVASARRNFEHAVSETQSLMHSHPDDYTLYRLGSFDHDTGVIKLIDPEIICKGGALVV